MSNIFRDQAPSTQLTMPNQEVYDRASALHEVLEATAETSPRLDVFDKGIVRKVLSRSEDSEPGGIFYEGIGGLATRESEPTEEELFDMGIDFAGRVVEAGKTPRGQILGYLAAGAQIDYLTIGFSGDPSQSGKGTRSINGSVDRLNDYMCDVVGDSLSKSPNTPQLIGAINTSLERAAIADEEHADVYQGFQAQLDELATRYDRIANLKAVVDKYYPETDQSESSAEREVVDSQITELTQAALAQRKYGIKPAYVPASIGGSWVFYDADDLKRRAPVLKKGRTEEAANMIGMVFHSPHAEHASLKISQQVDKTGPNHTYYLGGAMSDIEPDFGMIINADGSLSVDPNSVHTVGSILSDRPDAALRLKAEVAANIFDLTTPIDDHSEPGPRNFSHFSDEEKIDFDPITQLLIPRVRHLNRPPSESADVTRTVREHEVTWFVRPLPEGWRASPDAIARAKELNVELAPNETFVKAHTRGSKGEKALGYQAIKKKL